MPEAYGVTQVPENKYWGKDTLDYNAIIAGVWALTVNSSQYHCGWMGNTSDAINDEIEYKFSHDVDDLTLCLLCRIGAFGAIITIYIDGVSQGTIDLYNAGAVFNSIKTLAVSILTDGVHTMRIKVTARHASATNWMAQFSELWLQDT